MRTPSRISVLRRASASYCPNRKTCPEDEKETAGRIPHHASRVAGIIACFFGRVSHRPKPLKLNHLSDQAQVRISSFDQASVLPHPATHSECAGLELDLGGSKSSSPDMRNVSVGT